MKTHDGAICIFTTSYPRYEDDEAAIFIRNYVLGLSKAGGKGIVLVPKDHLELERETHGNFTVIRFKYGIIKKGALAFGSGIMPNIRQSPLCALQAPALLLSYAFHALRLRSQFTVIHCNWAITALPALISLLLTGKPYVITLRGEDVKLLRKPFFQLLLSFPFRFSRAITSVNEAAVAELSSIYPFCKDKIRCIPNGAEVALPDSTRLEEFKTMHPYLEKKNIALFIGTVIPRKQIDLLIEAVSLQELTDWTLIVIGRLQDSTYVSRLQKLIKEHSLSERVKLIGTIKPDEISYFLASATTYVSASEHEGRPNAALEAVAAELPVVLSDIAGHREITAQYSRGYLFDPEDPKSLATKLLAIDFENLPEPTAGKLKRSWHDAGHDYQALFSSIAR